MLTAPAVRGQSQAPQTPQTQTEVSVALVLAVDTSGSVSMDRFELQKQGYAAAFRNPQVLNAIRSLDTQSIAVTMLQWTGPLLHVVVVDWALIKDEASANAFAAAIDARAAPTVRRRHLDQRRHRLFARCCWRKVPSAARGASSIFPATAPTTAAGR